MPDPAQNIANIQSYIGSQISLSESRGTRAISDANAFLIALTNAALYAPNFIDEVAPGNILITTPTLTAIPPEKPTENINNIKSSIPQKPGDFTANIKERATQSVPQENFSKPEINFPTAPTFSKEIPPGSPMISLPTKIPDKPNIEIPDSLTVGGHTVPPIPSISLPDFGELLPSYNVELPTERFAYVEPRYTSALKDAIAAKLLTDVQNGGTGMDDDVESAIWNRHIERLRQQFDDDVDEAIGIWAARGFSLPDGVIATQVQELGKRFTDAREQASRDVAIESFKVANENTKFFLQTGLTLEELELNHANNVQNRALQAQRSVVEFGIALFNAKITEFNTRLARYQAKATEVQTRIAVQGLKLEQYKNELAGVEIKDKLDGTRIANYEAQLKSHDALVKLYEAEVGATIAAMNIERAKVEIFKSEIDAYIARIQAQRNEYELFQSKIEGEKAKIDLYKSEVDAYIARVNGVRISNDVVIEQIKADIAKEEMNLKAHLANVDIWKEKAQLAIQELNLEGNFYNADISKYREELNKEIAQANLNIESLVRGMQLEQENARIQLQTAIANVNMLIEQSKTRIAAGEGVVRGYVALASQAASVIQTMLQLGGQGISEETTTVEST